MTGAAVPWRQRQAYVRRSAVGSIRMAQKIDASIGRDLWRRPEEGQDESETLVASRCVDRRVRGLCERRVPVSRRRAVEDGPPLVPRRTLLLDIRATLRHAGGSLPPRDGPLRRQ